MVTPQMIEAILHAKGFYEAGEFMEQPHIVRELRDIADRARRREETERTDSRGGPVEREEVKAADARGIRGQCLPKGAIPLGILIVRRKC